MKNNFFKKNYFGPIHDIRHVIKTKTKLYAMFSLSGRMSRANSVFSLNDSRTGGSTKIKTAIKPETHEITL